MSDDLWDEAIKEAFASAPSDVVILDTIELIHPSFVDGEGNPTAIRVVLGHPHTETWLELAPSEVAAVLDAMSDEESERVGLIARLEDDAPVNAGEYVPFISLGFELRLPTQDPEAIPDLELTIDNVGREIVDQLDYATTSRSEVVVFYRPYISTDISGPKMDPPFQMELLHAKADVFRVKGTARVFDVGQRAFPSELYTAKDHPGLAR